METKDALMVLKMLAILGGIFALLSMLAGTAEASDDGLLHYNQCMKVEFMSGNPCVHKIPFFATFGVGKTPVSGSQKDDPPRTEGGNNWSMGLQMDGAHHYFAKDKTWYEMDGTPRQCTDPCKPCKNQGYCKYLTRGDGTFFWVRTSGN